MASCEYNKSEWFRLAKYVLERDSWTCTKCGIQPEKSELHVHHLCYILGKPIYDIHEDLLVTFCNKCHSEWHKVHKRREFASEQDALDVIRSEMSITKNPIQLTLSLHKYASRNLERLAQQSKNSKEEIVEALIYAFINGFCTPADEANLFQAVRPLGIMGIMRIMAKYIKESKQEVYKDFARSCRKGIPEKSLPDLFGHEATYHIGRGAIDYAIASNHDQMTSHLRHFRTS